MDNVAIGKLGESDFEKIISNAGGRRFSADDTRETKKNADFVLGDAVVELKLVSEEGLEKEERQRKVGAIFKARQPGRPVIVLRPDFLDEEGRRAYYDAMMGPLKTHIEKANKQLKRSAEDLGGNPVRVLLLINNGYAALSHNEFKEIAVRRSCNATHNIDVVVTAGLYYYSDTFDNYFFPEIDLFPIRADRPFTSYERFRGEWHRFGENHLTQNFIFGKKTHAEQRLPVQEFTYDLDGVTYVKPAPPIGKLSEFFSRGRLRQNSSGIKKCPIVARTFPDFDPANWRRFQERFPTDYFFRETYADWIQFREQQTQALSSTTTPFVPVTVEFNSYIAWCKRKKCRRGSQTVCLYANVLFEDSVRQLIVHAQDRASSSIVVPRYVLLVTEVIGQDMANDLSSIYLVNDDIAGERREPLLENQRMFFEHGLPVAAAFAMKRGVHAIRYEKDLSNAWV